jgi:hypothetical protein
LQSAEEFGVASRRFPEVEHQKPRVLGIFCGPIHDFLQDGFQAPPLCFVPDWRNLARRAELSQQTQAVEREHGQMHDGVIAVKLSRGWPFQIEVGFDFRVELFVRAVAPIEQGTFYHLILTSKRSRGTRSFL